MIHHAHTYGGMWVTNDGQIRQVLLPTGRYAEARATRAHAYQGRYAITGSYIAYIAYWDDTGFSADGEFINNVLYHGGLVLDR